MKKIVGTFLSILMCFGSCISVNAKTDIPESAKSVFTISSASCYLGETVTLDISLQCTEKVNSIALSGFLYDEDALEFIEFSEYDSELQSQMYFPVQPDAEKMALTIPLKQASDFNGKLCTMSFKVKANASVGTYTVSAVPLTKNKSDVIESFVVPSEISVSDKPKQNFTDLSFSDATYTYDGKEHALSVSGKLPDGATVEYTNEKATDAGTYNATAAIRAEGYNDLILKATLKIEPKDLTVSGLIAQDKTYDGTTDATIIGGELTGVAEGDDVTATFPAKGTFAKADVGNDIVVIADRVTLSGNDKGNYNLKQPTELKADITAAVLKVKADDVTMMKGTEVPILQYTVTEGKLFGNDQLTGTLATEADGTVIGTFDITQGTLKATSNYKMEFTKGTLTVADKKLQKITVSEISEKTYGDEAFKITVTPDPDAKLSDFTFESRDKTVATVSSDGTVTIIGAGETEIIVKQAGNEDYAPFIKAQKFTVLPKTITITALDPINKTVAFDSAVEKATLDFSLLVVDKAEKAENETFKILLSNFVLIGENSKNYTLSNKTFEATVSNENLVTISVTSDKGTVTGCGTYLKGAKVTLTAAPRFGWLFGGWYVENKRVSHEKTYVFTAGETVPEVKFTKKPNSSDDGSSAIVVPAVYTVRFVSNKGSAVNDRKVTQNGILARPDNPTREGYTFDGWYTDAGLTKLYDFDSRVNESFTLYAKWIEKIRTAPFTDVTENDWFRDAVEYVTKNGLMKGVSDTEFAPNTDLTRAMFITVLYRMENMPEANGTVFNDVVSGSWYEKAVAWAHTNGLVAGISDTEFAPENTITREQMAAILYRYADYKGYDRTAEGELTYSDRDKISDYALPAVLWMANKQIMSGNSDNTFAPKNTATRAQAAAVFMRITENLK